MENGDGRMESLSAIATNYNVMIIGIRSMEDDEARFPGCMKLVL